MTGVSVYVGVCVGVFVEEGIGVKVAEGAVVDEGAGVALGFVVAEALDDLDVAVAELTTLISAQR